MNEYNFRGTTISSNFQYLIQHRIIGSSSLFYDLLGNTVSISDGGSTGSNTLQQVLSAGNTSDIRLVLGNSFATMSMDPDLIRQSDQNGYESLIAPTYLTVLPVSDVDGNALSLSLNTNGGGNTSVMQIYDNKNGRFMNVIFNDGGNSLAIDGTTANFRITGNAEQIAYLSDISSVTISNNLDQVLNSGNTSSNNIILISNGNTASFSASEFTFQDSQGNTSALFGSGLGVFPPLDDTGNNISILVEPVNNNAGGIQWFDNNGNAINITANDNNTIFSQPFTTANFRITGNSEQIAYISDGVLGATGTQGAMGLQGPKGATGSQGPQGSIGNTGPQGAMGLQGPQGPKGATGSQGATGLQGPIGATGPQGPIGAGATGGGITGLTAGYITVARGATSIGNSIIYQSTTQIGINTITPISGYTLDVNGPIAFNGSINSRSGSDIIFYINNIKSGLINLGSLATYLGYQAGLNTTGNYNTFIGYDAGIGGAGSVGGGCAAIGYAALSALTSGDYNMAFGYLAGSSITSGPYNVAIGSRSLLLNTTGAYNISIGGNSLAALLTGNSNVAIGIGTLQAATGQYNVAVGGGSLTVLTTGDQNTVIGVGAAQSLTSGTNNIAIGNGQDLPSNIGSNQMNIGGIIFGTAMSGNVNAPAGQLGIGINTPDTSAILDITSTTKGILIPRMTTTQQNAISSPATGLLIYNTTLNTKQFYNGIIWKPIISATSSTGLTGGYIPYAVDSVSINNSPISVKATTINISLDHVPNYGTLALAIAAGLTQGDVFRTLENLKIVY